MNGFDLLDAVSKVGFPIAVAAYLLLRFEKKQDDLVQSIKGKDGILDKIEEVGKTLNSLKDKLDK